jgi:signal transduction histidine kinase
MKLALGQPKANWAQKALMASLSAELSTDQLARMVEVSRVLNSTTNLDSLLTYIIGEAADLTDSEAASILLLDPHSRQLFIVASSNEITEEMARTPVPLDSSIAGAVLQANEPLYVADVSTDPRWNRDVDQVIDFKTSEILGVPMHYVDRKPVGVLEAINRQHGTFSKQDTDMLAVFADLAGVAVEKARLFGELEQANKDLSELDQLKTDFISLASHELRTPLSIILGYVSFLREDADPTMASRMENVLKAATHLRDLIQSMLNFQYVDTGQTKLNLAANDIVSLVRDMACDKDETAAAKRQTITVTLPSEALPALVDRNMVEVIMGNLIGNAIKFTPEEGQIDIRVERHGSEVWCCVADSGVGISDSDLERIFRRFYQVESPLRRRFGGIGLGLSIAADLAELNHGRLWAESAGDQKGSTFYAAFPLNGSQNGLIGKS